MKKRVYISGKISGEDYSAAYNKFLRAQKAIETCGWEAVNPMLNQMPQTASWEVQMEMCIALLFTCEAIYMLPDWERSKGARIEHYIAGTMGLEIINN